MSKKTTTKTTATKTTSRKSKSAAPAAPAAPVTIEATPAPEALSAALVFEKKDKQWDAVIREGTTDHLVLEQRFEEEDDAKKAGDKWLAGYAKAKDAARRRLLGWKAAGAATAATATEATTAKPAAKDATGANVAKTVAKRGGKAKGEAKVGKESTRGPSGLDVAAQMLKDAGAAMKCKDVVEQMLAKGLWKTNGKTPSATIYAAIIREIAEKGKASRFTKTDRGTFAYNAAAENA